MVWAYWASWLIPVRAHHTLPGYLPAPPRYPWASLTYGTRGPKRGNNVKSQFGCAVVWVYIIVRVGGPGARQNGGCFWQWYAPPAFYRPILAPYYTRDPSWLFGAAPGGKMWATWPHQHHRMPTPILEAKSTSAAWTTTMAIQLARLPEFAPTSIYHPFSVPHNPHTEIRTGVFSSGCLPTLHP